MPNFLIQTTGNLHLLNNIMNIIAYGHLYEYVENSLETYIRRHYMKQILAKAQSVYDEWISSSESETFADEYFGGGICHLIADELSNMFNDNMELDSKTITYDDEVHVATLVRWSKDESSEVFNMVTVDIPWRLYETGGGYQFEPIQGVVFEESNVLVHTNSTTQDNWGSI